MTFDFDHAVDDYGGRRHDVVFHHLGDVFDFREADAEVVFADYAFNDFVCFFAFGTAGTKDNYITRS